MNALARAGSPLGGAGALAVTVAVGVAASLLAFAPACTGGDDAATEDACQSGAARSCTPPAECRAAEQICSGQSGDPTRWGPCECIEPAGSPDAAVDTDSGGRPALGGPCERDEECATGAACLSSGSTLLFGGSPPAGVCVADCTDDPQACNAFDNAACVPVAAGVTSDAGQDTASLCFERCAVGEQSGTKCHGTDGIACHPLTDGDTAGYCRPLCVTDEDCSDGACDPSSGACVSPAPAVSTDLGMSCNPAAAAAECGGLCAELSDTYAVCSRRCIFGEPGDCAPSGTATPEGGCVFVTPGGSIGDIGFCAELCDCPADCTAAASVCDPFNDASLEAAFGRSGVCTAAELALGEPIVCN